MGDSKINKPKKGHIYSKPDTVPHVAYAPVPVPHHEKYLSHITKNTCPPHINEKVKALLDQCVERGIIALVPSL